MQPIRTTASGLRVALAMLFAVMTVTQVPAMAIACATGSAQNVTATASHAAHHGSHSSHHSHHADVVADAAIADAAHDASMCFAMGCCLALGPTGVRAPAVMDVLLGSLDLAPTRVMLPAPPEPADPPPRLHV